MMLSLYVKLVVEMLEESAYGFFIYNCKYVFNIGFQIMAIYKKHVNSLEEISQPSLDKGSKRV